MQQVPLPAPLSPTKDSDYISQPCNINEPCTQQRRHHERTGRRVSKQSQTLSSARVHTTAVPAQCCCYVQCAARRLDGTEVRAYLEGNSFRGHDCLDVKVGPVDRHHLPRRDKQRKKAKIKTEKTRQEQPRSCGGEIDGGVCVQGSATDQQPKSTAVLRFKIFTLAQRLDLLRVAELASLLFHCSGVLLSSCLRSLILRSPCHLHCCI